MTVHICTVGWESPDRIIESMREFHPTKVYLIYGKETTLDEKGWARKVAVKIENVLGALIETRLVEVDPHDFVSSFLEMCKIIHDENNNIYINISGGTNILVASAILASITHIDKISKVYYGMPKRYAKVDIENGKYVSEGFDRKVELPIFLNEFDKMKEKEDIRKIFEVLNKKKQVSSLDELTSLVFNRVYTQKDKTQKMADINRVRYNLALLKKLGYVETVKEKRKLKIEITEPGRNVAQLILHG